MIAMDDSEPLLQLQQQQQQRQGGVLPLRMRYPSYQTTSTTCISAAAGTAIGAGDGKAEEEQADHVVVAACAANSSRCAPSSKKPRSFSRAQSFMTKSFAALCFCSVLLIVGTQYNNNHSVFPTAREIALAEHYYGDSILNSFVLLPKVGSTWRIREAQQTADAARKEQLLVSSVSSSQPPQLRSTTDNHDNNAKNAEEAPATAAAEQQEAQQQQQPLIPSQRRRALKHHQHHDDKDDSRHEEFTHTADQHDHHHHHPLHEGCEATVVLLRHCEKGSITEHCALQGYERSIYLASLFGTSSAARWPAPSYVFAEAPNARHSRHKMNFRELETVGPLAAQSHVTVDDSHADLRPLSKRLLAEINQGHLCGKVAVIVWKHSSIAHAARVLGCGPAEGCPVDYSGKTFDQVWQIKFVYRQWEHSNHKNEFILNPDAESATWKVFGSVQYENFDPLAVSKQFGDYPPGGTSAGQRWEKKQVSYPERTKRTDTGGWAMTRVGFPMPDAVATTHSNADGGGD